MQALWRSLPGLLLLAALGLGLAYVGTGFLPRPEPALRPPEELRAQGQGFAEESPVRAVLERNVLGLERPAITPPDSPPTPPEAAGKSAAVSGPNATLATPPAQPAQPVPPAQALPAQAAKTSGQAGQANQTGQAPAHPALSGGPAVQGRAAQPPAAANPAAPPAQAGPQTVPQAMPQATPAQPIPAEKAP